MEILDAFLGGLMRMDCCLGLIALNLQLLSIHSDGHVVSKGENLLRTQTFNSFRSIPTDMCSRQDRCKDRMNCE